jgi:hypothetical protein
MSFTQEPQGNFNFTAPRRESAKLDYHEMLNFDPTGALPVIAQTSDGRSSTFRKRNQSMPPIYQTHEPHRGHSI